MIRPHLQSWPHVMWVRQLGKRKTRFKADLFFKPVWKWVFFSQHQSFCTTRKLQNSLESQYQNVEDTRYCDIQRYDLDQHQSIPSEVLKAIPASNNRINFCSTVYTLCLLEKKQCHYQRVLTMTCETKNLDSNPGCLHYSTTSAHHCQECELLGVLHSWGNLKRSTVAIKWLLASSAKLIKQQTI